MWKKGLTRMRMILDCRRSNVRFRTPPSVDVLTCEGMPRMEVEFGSDSLEALRIPVGSADV